MAPGVCNPLGRGQRPRPGRPVWGAPAINPASTRAAEPATKAGDPIKRRSRPEGHPQSGGGSPAGRPVWTIRSRYTPAGAETSQAKGVRPNRGGGAPARPRPRPKRRRPHPSERPAEPRATTTPGRHPRRPTSERRGETDPPRPDLKARIPPIHARPWPARVTPPPGLQAWIRRSTPDRRCRCDAGPNQRAPRPARATSRPTTTATERGDGDRPTKRDAGQSVGRSAGPPVGLWCPRAYRG